MKKIVYSMIMLLSFVLLSVAFVTVTKTRQKNSDLFILNVEALSRIESSGQYIDCYKNIESDPSDYVTYCGTCSDIPGRWKGGMSFCEKK